ncbi:hypothetical protein V6N12_074616 [Hibiscus sabdariffa]|uniref:Uncharacterized protein n=1 Tax=Hibiscus sabdariffa TaxID=183260 RepID=A0ABR2BZH9_9ROSI
MCFRQVVVESDYFEAEVLIKHVGRTTNGVADSLVVALRGHELGEICHVSEPPELHGLLIDDLYRATGVAWEVRSYWNSSSSKENPQIEVTFEVDANGILNVKAEDKGTGKSEKIAITNNKSRLSQEIERMVREVEEFVEEDKKVKEKIDARNSLKTYVYNMKNQISDKDKLTNKLEYDDKEKVERKEWGREGREVTAAERDVSTAKSSYP